jgi:hypothetical protein
MEEDKMKGMEHSEVHYFNRLVSPLLSLKAEDLLNFP